MFGYVIANKDIMTEEQEARYRACYCGLCHALHRRHGSLSRVTLTYDMTFLVLLLNSMYEPEEAEGSSRCVMHPVRRHDWVSSWVTEYAADMNLALAYLKCMDDWKDERRFTSRCEAAVLSEEYFYVTQKYPEKCKFINDCLDELSEIERRGETDPDAGARCFGRLMGEIFAEGPDRLWSERLRLFGQELGEFIYIMDAVLDPALYPDHADRRVRRGVRAAARRKGRGHYEEYTLLRRMAPLQCGDGPQAWRRRGKAG